DGDTTHARDVLENRASAIYLPQYTTRIEAAVAKLHVGHQVRIEKTDGLDHDAGMPGIDDEQGASVLERVTTRTRDDDEVVRDLSVDNEGLPAIENISVRRLYSRE